MDKNTKANHPNPTTMSKQLTKEEVTQSHHLYKKFKDALNIQYDMRPSPNPFIVSCIQITEHESEKRAVAWDIFKVKGGWKIAGYNESEKEDPMYIHVSGNKKRYSDLYQYFIENIYNK